jgi:transcriptional regulator with XRE-family HTH domain
MTATASSLGRAIKDARERRHLTQLQLADILGVDRKTVDNWEHERTIPRNRMAALVQWAPELGSSAPPPPSDPQERKVWDLAIQDMDPEAAWEVVGEYRRRRRRIA